MQAEMGLKVGVKINADNSGHTKLSAAWRLNSSQSAPRKRTFSRRVVNLMPAGKRSQGAALV